MKARQSIKPLLENSFASSGSYSESQPRERRIKKAKDVLKNGNGGFRNLSYRFISSEKTTENNSLEKNSSENNSLEKIIGVELTKIKKSIEDISSSINNSFEVLSRIESRISPSNLTVGKKEFAQSFRFDPLAPQGRQVTKVTATGKSARFASKKEASMVLSKAAYLGAAQNQQPQTTQQIKNSEEVKSLIVLLKETLNDKVKEEKKVAKTKKSSRFEEFEEFDRIEKPQSYSDSIEKKEKKEKAKSTLRYGGSGFSRRAAFGLTSLLVGEQTAEKFATKFRNVQETEEAYSTLTGTRPVLKETLDNKVKEETRVTKSKETKGTKESREPKEISRSQEPQSYSDSIEEKEKKEKAKSTLRYGGSGFGRKAAFGLTSLLVGEKMAEKVGTKFRNVQETEEAYSTLTGRPTASSQIQNIPLRIPGQTSIASGKTKTQELSETGRQRAKTEEIAEEEKEYREDIIERLERIEKKLDKGSGVGVFSFGALLGSLFGRFKQLMRVIFGPIGKILLAIASALGIAKGVEAIKDIFTGRSTSGATQEPQPRPTPETNERSKRTRTPRIPPAVGSTTSTPTPTQGTPRIPPDVSSAEASSKQTSTRRERREGRGRRESNVPAKWKSFLRWLEKRNPEIFAKFMRRVGVSLAGLAIPGPGWIWTAASTLGSVYFAWEIYSLYKEFSREKFEKGDVANLPELDNENETFDINKFMQEGGTEEELEEILNKMFEPSSMENIVPEEINKFMQEGGTEDDKLQKNAEDSRRNLSRNQGRFQAQPQRSEIEPQKQETLVETQRENQRLNDDRQSMQMPGVVGSTAPQSPTVVALQPINNVVQAPQQQNRPTLIHTRSIESSVSTYAALIFDHPIEHSGTYKV